MIRVLFIIVAIVAAIMAVLLQQPLLYVAAGVALVISVVLIALQLQKRRASHKQVSSAYVPPKQASDNDLSSLGILEIKPRQKGQTSEKGAESAETSAEAETENRAERPLDQEAVKMPERGPEKIEEKPRPHVPETNGNRATAPVTLTIKEKAQTVRAFVDESAAEHYRDVLVPYIQALRSAVDAQTVCLLKQSDDTIHHHIEAIVSLNAYARSGGHFSSKVPLVHTRDARAPAAIRKVAADDLPAGGLGYYRESIAVKEVAVASVPSSSPNESYVLLADSMQEGGLDTDRRRALVGHFARLLGAVLETGDSAQMAGFDYVRPRREIISEEITKAREKQTPLALALVHLNEAEAVADLGERQIKSAEQALAGRIHQTALQARVERFGELTFGVFFQSPGSEVESWAVSLQREIEQDDGLLRGGISIGIAMLQERHRDADSFRQDATDALREAYESGTCTIVE